MDFVYSDEGEILMVTNGDISPLGLRRVDAAKALSIIVATLDRLTKRGELKCVKTDAIVIYPVHELKRWLGTPLRQ